MDPILFYGGLFQLSTSLATIVNVALGTPAGRKTLDSTLKELPILFSLLEEMKTGILETTTSIPHSAILARNACQIDLDNVVKCLSQRGLVGESLEGFSNLQRQLSINHSQNASTLPSPKKHNLTKTKQIVKEKLNLLDVDALAAAVGSFKNSVLLLRDIAMDLRTHSQQDLLLDALRSFLDPSTSDFDAEYVMEGCEDQETNERYSQVDNIETLFSPGSIACGSISSGTADKAEQGRQPSEGAPLKVKKFLLPFDVRVYRDPESHPSIGRGCMPARMVLDTGSVNNLISERTLVLEQLEHLKSKLEQEMTWILGDGKTELISRSEITLKWYIDRGSMKSYKTHFYVVEVEHYDMLLGREFYDKDGDPKLAEEKAHMMQNFLAPKWRPKSQREAEYRAASEAEKAAKSKLQHDREQAIKVSEIVPATVSPVPVRKRVPTLEQGKTARGRRPWSFMRRSKNGNDAGASGTMQAFNREGSTQHSTPDPANTHENPSKDSNLSTAISNETDKEPSHHRTTLMPAATHDIPSKSSNSSPVIENTTVKDLNHIIPIPDPMVTSNKTPCKDSQAPTGPEGRTVQEPGHINRKPLPGTARELPSKIPEPSSEGRTVEEPRNIQLPSQKHAPAEPQNVPANAKAKVAVEELVVTVANATPSANTSTGSPKCTTTPEGRTSGTRVAKSGPQEVPKTLPDETKAVPSPPVLLVPNGFAKSLEPGSYRSGEDEIGPTQQLERQRAQRLKTY